MNDKTWQINSVGIDIGTTTTQVIFSKLEVVNRASISQVPAYEFSKRDIIYVSPIIVTPINFEGNVRVEELRSFILGQYKIAGFTPETVESGAIIITGESLKAGNARDTIMELSRSLGDFIVATAGPHLESVIAGQGSGAEEYSREYSARVLNIDVGGGTSNYVVFEAGRIIDTACLNVGGRLVEFNEDGSLKRLHKPAQIVCEALFSRIPNQLNMNDSDTQKIADTMAELIYLEAKGQGSALSKKLMQTESLKEHRYDAVFISGGVGECFYYPEKHTSLNEFLDYGPRLAQSLHQSPHCQTLPIKVPKHTVRATVIGAGAYTLSLSGSTIWLDQQHLPIKNIPVVHTQGNWLGLRDNFLHFVEAIEIAAKRMDIDLGKDLCAIALPKDFPLNYEVTSYCVETFTELAKRYMSNNHPLLIVAEQDLGKALGMLLKPNVPQREIAVIDEIVTHLGDYIDIGKAFHGGEMLPITIKSLAFPS